MRPFGIGLCVGGVTAGLGLDFPAAVAVWLLALVCFAVIEARSELKR